MAQQNTKHDYKDGKYLICLYNTEDDDDGLVASFDTAQEFADYIQTNLRHAYNILLNHRKRNDKKIFVDNKCYELHCVRI